MKNWCKILKLKNYDVLVERVVTKDDGEHVKITVRFPDGQFVKSACMGDGEEAEKQSIELFNTYSKKEATLFIDELDKLIESNGKEESNEAKN